MILTFHVKLFTEIPIKVPDDKYPFNEIYELCGLDIGMRNNRCDKCANPDYNFAINRMYRKT